MNFLNYLQSVKLELKEVSWPSRAQTISYTLVVIGISAIVALFLGGVDFGLKSLLTYLLK